MTIVEIGRCAYEVLSDDNWVKTDTRHQNKILDVNCGCASCRRL